MRLKRVRTLSCRAVALMASAALLAFLLGAPTAADDVDVRWTFDDGTLAGWVVQEGDWRVVDGELVHNDRHFKGGLVGRPGEVFAELTLEANVRIPEVFWNRETVWVGVIFRATDPVANGPWRDGYLFLIRANGEVNLTRAGGPVLGSDTTLFAPRQDVVRLKIVAEGARMRGYVNDTLLIDARDSAFEKGEVALVNYGNISTFDNVRISGTRCEREEPALVEPIQPAPEPREPVTPLARVAIRKAEGKPGEFYIPDTGKRFRPRGFNYTVLAEGWHATFNVGTYDAEAADETLARMAALGANTIRLWAWGKQSESGFTDGPEGLGLNGAYMENFVDFLSRATAHGIYVVPILDEVPRNAYYDNVSRRASGDADEHRITGYNRRYLTRGAIAAKCAAARDFVRYVKQADEGLLSTILGWSLANEVFVNHTEGPFRLNEGSVTTGNGVTYDMGDRDARQACYDETILYWANELAETIKRVDPQALVTAGMWTSDAHGRAPVSYLIPDDKDPRRPPRPSVLAGSDSQLDFLDIHIYPWDGTSKVRPEAHEWDAVMAGSIPAIAGEYGAFKRDAIDDARAIIREIHEQAYRMGYEGDLFWVWDLTGQKHNAWSAVEEGLAEYVMGLGQ